MGSETRIKLDEYEMWIESEIENGNFVPVDNFDKWKEALQKAACRTVDKLRREKRIRLTIEISSPETKDEVIKLLKDRFGKEVKVLD